MGTAYFSREDVIRRLDGTICFYSGYPYYVSCGGSSKGDDVTLYALDKVSFDKPAMTVKYTDPRFNYKSPSLGYMFYKKKQAVYISRLPDRNQSQGLSQRVLLVTPSIVDYGRYTLTKEFEDMLLGIYPSRTVAEELLKNDLCSSVPISRNIALSHTRRGLLEICFKGRPIACNLKGRGFELYDLREKSYLSKLLANDGIFLG